MRRNLKNIGKTVQGNSEKIEYNGAKLDQILKELSEMKPMLTRLTVEKDMDYVDMQKYFPCSSKNTLLAFMSNEDGEYEKRRKSFENMLYCSITNPSNKRLFSDTMMSCLFTRSFVNQHKWPSSE